MTRLELPHGSAMAITMAFAPSSLAYFGVYFKGGTCHALLVDCTHRETTTSILFQSVLDDESFGEHDLKQRLTP